MRHVEFMAWPETASIRSRSRISVLPSDLILIREPAAGDSHVLISIREHVTSYFVEGSYHEVMLKVARAREP